MDNELAKKKELIKKVVTAVDKWRIPISAAANGSFEDYSNAINELLGMAKKTGDDTAISALTELDDAIDHFVSLLSDLDDDIYEAEQEFAAEFGIDASEEGWV